MVNTFFREPQRVSYLQNEICSLRAETMSHDSLPAHGQQLRFINMIQNDGVSELENTVIFCYSFAGKHARIYVENSVYDTTEVDRKNKHFSCVKMSYTHYAQLFAQGESLMIWGFAPYFPKISNVRQMNFFPSRKFDYSLHKNNSVFLII